MIILEKKCLLDGANASSTTESSELSETWYIKYDEIADDASNAISHSGFFCGDEHPNNVWLSLQSIDAESISGQEWILSLNYTTEQTNVNNIDNPQDFKTDVQFSKWNFLNPSTNLVFSFIDIFHTLRISKEFLQSYRTNKKSANFFLVNPKDFISFYE